MILLLIVLVAAFNIISTLIMVVTDKTREIGILRAMGMPARSIRRVFFAQGLVIGVVGTGAGLVIGLVASVPDRRASKLIALDPSIYFIDHLPVATQPLDVTLHRRWPVWRWPPWRRSIRRSKRRVCTRWRRFVTNDRCWRRSTWRRCTSAATAARSPCSTASTSRSRAARWWPSSARAARARARCCICSARSTSRRAAHVRDRRASRSTGRTRRASCPTLRNRSIGFVFQFHHLLREFTALENVMMPLRIAGWDDDRARGARARSCSRASDSAGAWSTGRRRSRAASNSGPRSRARWRSIRSSLLADEPSGNLDHTNSERLHDLFAELSRDLEIAMVIATHNRSLAARADRTLLLEDGRLTDTDVREVVP